MADTKAPYGDVPYGDPGYLDADGNQASKSGKPGVKRYPLSADKVMAAWSYINQAKNASQYTAEQLSAIRGRVKAAMAKHGHDVSDGDSDSSSRTESLAPYVRSFPLEDIHIRSSGDGRTVEAYAAVFGVPAEVKDQDGHYMEEIDPVAFNRAISDAAPQGSRRDWRVGVFFNHGMTIHGTPAEAFSMPVGIPLEITADGHGVKTVTRYHRGDLEDKILERIAAGSLPGYSFTGHFRRSQPLIPRGGFRPDRYGKLPTVRRMESTFKEYGPTPFPIYEGAAVTGMRSDLLSAMVADPDVAIRMLTMLRDGAHDSDSPPLSGAPAPGLAAEDSHVIVRSGRSVKQEMNAARSAFLQRQHRR